MVFAFRTQPLKSLYIVGALFYVLGALPLWIAADAFPARRPRSSWTMKRCILVRLLRLVSNVLFQTGAPYPTPLVECEPKAKALGFVWVPAAPNLVVGEIRDLAQKNNVEAERTAGFWYGPRGPDGSAGQRASPVEKVIYYFHGGGHIMGTAHPKGGLMGACDGYLAHLGSNVRIFCLEYRLSSAAPFKKANPFPASLIDAIAGYRYLVEYVGFAPSQIILSGDSAGGGIAFNLARYLAMANLPSLSVPAGTILLSPTSDWAQTHTGAHSSMARNIGSDFVDVVMSCGYTKRALLGDLPEDMAAKSAWISPGSLHVDRTPGMFAGFPPTLIVAGGGEYTLDPMHAVEERLREDIGEDKVAFIEVPDICHAFLVYSWFEPERSATFINIAKWVDGLWNAKMDVTM